MAYRPKKPKLRWGVEQRLEFLEFRLFWEGRMNRSDLIGKFGVSVNQASGDLNRYIRMAPENMVYDKSARCYVPSDTFKPLFLKIDSDQYLNQLRSVVDGIMTADASLIRRIPTSDAVPSPTRVVAPKTLRAVLRALRSRLAIEVRYQSLARPKPRWRWVSPHALGFDGFRWHVRAFCETDQVFKDFLLARIVGVRDERPADSDPNSDSDWYEHVDLEIGPHPGLSESQRQVIELDYGMQDGRTTFRVRRAFAFYAAMRLGLDRDPGTVDPSSQQIVLLNREAIAAYLPAEDQRESS